MLSRLAFSSDQLVSRSEDTNRLMFGISQAEIFRQACLDEPVIFLCATDQDAQKAINVCTSLHIAIEKFSSRYISKNCLAGHALLACTYDSMNEIDKTLSDLGLRAAAIIIDDIYFGADRTKAMFALTISSQQFTDISQILESTCCGIYRGYPQYDLENQNLSIPLWIYKSAENQISEALRDSSDTQEMLMDLSNFIGLSEKNRLCDVGVSAMLELRTADLHPLSTFQHARHRFYVSAAPKFEVNDRTLEFKIAHPSCQSC